MTWTAKASATPIAMASPASTKRIGKARNSPAISQRQAVAPAGDRGASPCAPSVSASNTAGAQRMGAKSRPCRGAAALEPEGHPGFGQPRRDGLAAGESCRAVPLVLLESAAPSLNGFTPQAAGSYRLPGMEVKGRRRLSVSEGLSQIVFDTRRRSVLNG